MIPTIRHKHGPREVNKFIHGKVQGTACSTSGGPPGSSAPFLILMMRKVTTVSARTTV